MCEVCFYVEDPVDAGLELIEVDLQYCWRKDDSQIIVGGSPAGNIQQQVWVRFRQEREGTSDFLVLLESESQSKAYGHLMIASQATGLKGVAEQCCSIRDEAFGYKFASNGMLSIHLTVEQDTIKQGMFVVKLAKTTILPNATVNATFELELQEVMLYFVAKAREEERLRLEMGNFNQKRGTSLTLESVRSRLDAIDEEKSVLERIEKLHIEILKDMLPMRRKWESLADRALENRYMPVKDDGMF